MIFFNDKNTQQLKQRGGNGGREKKHNKLITMDFFVILLGISVQSKWWTMPCPTRMAPGKISSYILLLII